MSDCTICKVIDGNKGLGIGTLYRTPTQALLTAPEGESLGEHHLMFVSRDHDNRDEGLALYHRAVDFVSGTAPLAPTDERYVGGEIMAAITESGHYVVHLYGKGA